MGLKQNNFQTVQGIKNKVSVPVFHAGGINDSATARHLIKEGIVDMVGMTRAQIADPYLVAKLNAGKESHIRPCVGLGYCVDRVNQGKPAVCGHSVATGREARLHHIQVKTTTPKKVVIAGGGVGGMEAARIAASQGHNVTLFEASPQLGGQLKLAAKSIVRQQICGITAWLTDELDRLQVDIRLNSYADNEDILPLSPDLVITATGGSPNETHFPGSMHALSSWDVLAGHAHPHGSVLLWDETGTHAGAVTAEYLAQHAEQLHFATPDTEPLTELGATTKPVTLRSLYQQDVNFLPNRDLTAITAKGNRKIATLQNVLTKAEESVVIDAVIIENGTTPNAEVFESLCSLSHNNGVVDLYALSQGQPCFNKTLSGGEFYLARIGDAIASRNIHASMLEAARLLHSWSEHHT
jgi:thioredoxin reductase